MKTLPAMLLAALCAMPASACDKVEAAKLQLALAEMGVSWSERGDGVTVEWGRAWDGAGAALRRHLLQTFARGDACLSGAVRPIEFRRKGRLVGMALAGGVELEPEPVRSAGAGAPGAACQ